MTDRAPSPTEAHWRVALGIGQMVVAAGVVVLWLGGAHLALGAAAFVLACALTALSIARWGGFWKQP